MLGITMIQILWTTRNTNNDDCKLNSDINSGCKNNIYVCIYIYTYIYIYIYKYMIVK